MSRNYHNDLSIDQDDLNRCWIEQPILYMEWSEKWADACKERDQFKEQLELAKADAVRAVKKDPKKFGIADNPTVQIIDATVSKHKKVMAAADKYNDAVHNARVLDLVRTAFEHRRRALQGLTQLWTTNYWGSIDTPEGQPATSQHLRDKMKESASGGRKLNKSKKLIRRPKNGS